MTELDRIVAALRDPAAYPHVVARVERIETHISHVLLAGDYAYKLKKRLALGFLDFSTLERRKFFCEEEIRLNGRLAPDVYLVVVPITGGVDAARVGGSGPVIEYAVKMRRFDQECLLTKLPLDGELADRIAERVAEFHQAIPVASADTRFGRPAAVVAPMVENFKQIRSWLADSAIDQRLRPLEEWTLQRHQSLWAQLERRRREGHVRECHGDMHRGNIVYERGEILIFDGIEFNADLRWIDTMSEIAFLVMDLEEAGEIYQARRLLNRYLELNGDYGGLAVLDFYKVYRSLVRAKVTAIRLGQDDAEPSEALQARRELFRYLDLAQSYTRPPGPWLYLTYGASGAGKSRLATALRERLPFLIHIRSDVERKRLYGLPATERTRASIGAGIYTSEAGRRTYARLRDLATAILDSGYSPLVDATFLQQTQRRPFLELARDRGVPCTILELSAPPSVLRARVEEREAGGRDASEAGVGVLESQLASREPLTAEEREIAISVDTTRRAALAELLQRLAA
jgi:aminoglycoside phosphotransferase family enzyme/predicted kinase